MGNRTNITSAVILFGGSMSLWINWVVFTFLATSLFPNSPFGSSDNSPLALFLTALPCCCLVAFLARKTSIRLSKSLPTQYAIVAIACIGGLIMSIGTPACILVGITLCALGSTVLVIAWSTVYTNFNASEAENIVLIGIAVSTVCIMGLLWVPDQIRYALSQILPLLSLTAVHFSGFLKRQESSSEPKETSVLNSSSKWTWHMRVGMIAGLGGSSFLCYAFLPLVTSESLGRPFYLDTVAIGLGCIVALAATSILFHYSTSISPFSIFFTCASLVGLAILFSSAPAWSRVGCALAVTLLIALMHLLWGCLSKTAPLEKDDPIHYFLGGNLIYQCAALAGASASFIVGPYLTDNPSNYQFALHAIACIAILLGSFMAITQPTRETLPVARNANISLKQVVLANLDDEGADMEEAAVARICERAGLSQREAEIFTYLVKGRSTPYIRDRLFVSANTVNSHIRRIYIKTGVHSRQGIIDLFEQELHQGN